MDRTRCHWSFHSRFRREQSRSVDIKKLVQAEENLTPVSQRPAASLISRCLLVASRPLADLRLEKLNGRESFGVAGRSTHGQLITTIDALRRFDAHFLKQPIGDRRPAGFKSGGIPGMNSFIVRSFYKQWSLLSSSRSFHPPHAHARMLSMDFAARLSGPSFPGTPIAVSIVL